MSAKRKRRRQAFDDMKSERSRGTSNSSTTTRHPLTSDQITSFLQAIRTKQKASFGLVKLRQLQLNSLITIPWLSDHNDGRRCQMTLLEYAAFRGRDAIVSCLLRGGADPYMRANDATTNAVASQSKVKDEEEFNDQKEFTTSPEQYLASFSLQYGTYVVNRLAQMRVHPNTVKHDALCVFCHLKPIDAPLLSKCRIHFVCESCCWLAMQDVHRQCNDEILDVCLQCHNKDWTPLHINGTVSISSLSNLVVSSTVSLSKFLMLPPDVNSTGSTANPATEKKRKRQGKLKMRGMSKFELRSEYLGSTQVKRTEQFFKAAQSGDYLRVASLLTNGIDVNATDENGETALIMASENITDLQHLSLLFNYQEKDGESNTNHQTSTHGCVVYLLLQSGADPSKKTHEGWSASDRIKKWSKKEEEENKDKEITSKRKGLSSSSSLPLSLSLMNARKGLRPMGEVKVVELISSDVNHPGAGSWQVDNLFNEEFLSLLDDMFQTMPSPPQTDHDNAAFMGGGTTATTKVSSSGKQTARNYSNTCASRKFFRARHNDVVETLQRGLLDIFQSPTPPAPSLSSLSSSSSLFSSSSSSSSLSLSGLLHRPTIPLPRMRFLNYDAAGGEMKPHVDLSKTYLDALGNVYESTHTFILHLRDSAMEDGGETVLLETLRGSTKDGGTKNKKNKTSSDNTNSNSNKKNGTPKILASIAPKRGRLLFFPHICPHAGLIVHNAGKKLFLRGELAIATEE